MLSGRRLIILGGWATFAVCASLLYLQAGWFKTAIVTFFVGISIISGFGQRWVIRGSFLIAVLAIAVLLGFPAPAQWAQMVPAPAQWLQTFPGLFNCTRPISSTQTPMVDEK